MRLHGMVLAISLSAASAAAAAPSFEDFGRRAENGERLVVVFFGASLTWGANATDPATTSYRARLAEYLEEAYPRAHFKFYDAAIGGTGSQLGVFRLERDVLRRKPDLVFLDFSANDDIYSDDPETLASYESLIRRIIAEGKCPVVQMLFPFGWNVKQGNTEGMKRRDANFALAQAYQTQVADAITLALERVKKGETTVEKIWPHDLCHPGDYGYRLFADAAWEALQKGIKEKTVCRLPEKMLYADTYMTNARVRLSTLGDLPAGWTKGMPNLTAAWHDGLMSRWLDDVVIARNYRTEKNAEGKDEKKPQTAERFRFRVKCRVLAFFGESTPSSASYRVWIDGKPRRHVPHGKKEETDLFTAANNFGGNVQHWQIIATDLDQTAEHEIAIEPVFEAGKEQELRLESVCVAGGEAKVRPAE
ncbi:MAG: SGNH/GDSL hydrolase family protein [Planctomycetota bacterium]|nr:SGNH/GDSL hydrolase family protein [Planctomycetota bacterium]